MPSSIIKASANGQISSSPCSIRRTSAAGLKNAKTRAALLHVNVTFEIPFVFLSAQGPGAAVNPSMTMSLPYDRS